MKRVLLTGAAGDVGGRLRRLLKPVYAELRLSDLKPPADLAADEPFLPADLARLEQVEGILEGVEGIVHLGGFSREASWETILQANIIGCYNLFEAARRRGVARVVFASSNHAVGFHTPDEFPLPEAIVPFPDTYYGVSKVAGEALGALYAKRYGLDVISIRILSCFERPKNLRMLATWLSPDDCARLLEACLAADKPGYRVVYGVSANTRGGWVSLDEARALGYEPKDDSEAFAAELIARDGEPVPGDPVLAHLGGDFTLPDKNAEYL